MDARRFPPNPRRGGVDDDVAPADRPAADGRRPKPRLVCPPLRSTPAGLTSGGWYRRPLPPDLVRQASQRLEVVALLAALLWIVATVLFHLIDLRNSGIVNWMSFQSSDALVGGGAAISIA